MIKYLTKRINLFILLSILFLPYGIAAQEVDTLEVKKSAEMRRVESWIDNTHIVTSMEDGSPTDTLGLMLERFYYDQFRHAQDPRAPYFMFMSKTGKLAMGVGGQIKIRGYFDWNGSIPSVGFTPYLIPIPKNPTAMRNLSASASGTGLFFTILGSNKILGDYLGYFQADFSGYNNRGFRIKKAYLTFRDWTVGYATTTFEDTKAEPETVDGSGPNGINSKKNVLVRYLHTFKKNHWSVAGSLEFPTTSITTTDTLTKPCNSYLPDIAAFVQYQWNHNQSHVRLSGLFRTLTYRDLLMKRNYNVMGWGVQLSTVIKALPQFNIFGIFSTGRGHASYTTDLGNGDFDLIEDYDNPGKLYAPLAAGFVFGLQYYFKPNLYSNLALSEQTYYPKHDPHNDQYKYGFYGVANIFWDITPRLEIGLEYLHGRRRNFDHMRADADRVMAMFMLSF